jgi:porin
VVTIKWENVNRTMKRLCCLFAGMIFIIEDAQLHAAGDVHPVRHHAQTSAHDHPDDYLAQSAADAVFPSHETPLPTQPGFWEQATMTGEWGGLRRELGDDGFTVSPSYTSVILGNPSGGIKQGIVSDGLFNVALDFDLEKMSAGAVNGLLIHINALYAYGPDPSLRNIGDFSGVSPIATYNSVRLEELWLEKSFLDKRLSIRVGNLSLNDFFVSTSSSLYLNGTINSLITPIADNVPNLPLFPVASPGVRLQFLPTPQTYVITGVYGMDSNSNPATNNQHGTRFALNASSGVLIMTEAGYLLNQSPQDTGLKGTYRIGSFVHTANYDTLASKAQNAVGAGPLRSGGSNYGVYGLAEQQLYAHGARSISLFLGGGGAPSNIDFVAWSLEGGFNFSGFIPGRDHDVAGVSFARSTVSSDFSASAVSLGGAPFTVQSVLEVTYRVQIAPWLFVQPDFQYIVNPGAEHAFPNAIVLGMSTSIAF